MANVERYSRTQGLAKRSGAARQQQAFDAGARAKAVMGKQISEAGDALAKAAVYLRDKRAAVEIASARAWAQKQVNNFILESSKNPGGFAKTADNFQALQETMEEHLQDMFTDNDSRSKFMNEFMPIFYENARFQVAKMAQAQERDYTIGKAMDILDDAIKSGDMAGIDLAVNSMDGLVSQEKLQSIRESAQNDCYRNIEFAKMKVALAAEEEWEVSPETKEALGEAKVHQLEEHWRGLQSAQRAEKRRAEQELRTQVENDLYSRLDSGQYISSAEIDSYTKPNADGLVALSPSTAHAMKRAVKAMVEDKDRKNQDIASLKECGPVLDAINNAASTGDLDTIKIEILTAYSEGKITSKEKSVLLAVRTAKEHELSGQETADAAIKRKYIGKGEMLINNYIAGTLGDPGLYDAAHMEFIERVNQPDVTYEQVREIAHDIAREYTISGGFMKQDETLMTFNIPGRSDKQARIDYAWLFSLDKQGKTPEKDKAVAQDMWGE